MNERLYRRRLAGATAVLLMAACSVSPAHAQGVADRVRRQTGLDTGQVTATTPLGLTISKGGVESTVPAEEIESVTFGGEPPELNVARNAIEAGRAQDGLDALAKIAADPGRRPEIVADIEYFTVLAKAQLALSGQGATETAAAEVRGFVSRQNKSFHIPAAIELLGDLLSAAGQHSAARTEYARLAKAKSKYYELRSTWLVGRTWQAEGDQEKALAEFDKVLASPESGTLVEPIKQSATLDRAVSQAAVGKVDEATATIGEIIAKASPEDSKLLARAYNALGDCYLKANDPKGALYSFLHVDLLFNKEADAHAKALHELATLWKTTGHANRGQDAAAELAEKYPNSRWAKQ